MIHLGLKVVYDKDVLFPLGNILKEVKICGKLEENLNDDRTFC